MVSLKKTIIAAGLLTFLPASTLLAATELTQQQAQTLQPFKEISVRGPYLSFNEAAKDVSKLADKEGATGFYIKSMNMHSRNESLRIVYADLYKSDAPEISDEDKVEDFRQFRGVYEYPKRIAVGFEPYDIVKLRAYYPNQHDINNAVGKAAAAKGAYAFYIDRQVEVNGRNTEITAYLFQKDAPIRHVQPDDAIPYDSEAGRLALAEGGDAALQVEKPGYYSSTAFNEQYYAEKFKGNQRADVTAKTVTTAPATTVETVTAQNKQAQSAIESQAEAVETKSILAKPANTRYTVTLADGTVIQELNDATAAKMVPFDSLKFRGYYVSDNEISNQAAKRAAAQGAKYYHISRIAQDPKGPNRTIYIDLFR